MSVRRLTNKQAHVLEVLRASGPLTCNEVAEKVMAAILCASCDGSGEGSDDRFGCLPCYGRGHPPFYYSQAYQALKALRVAGLVSRSWMQDAWGDEIPLHLYLAEPPTRSDDELEELWNAPSYLAGSGREQR